MKVKAFLISVLASALAFASCGLIDIDPLTKPARLEFLTEQSINFGSDATSQQVSFIATRNWKIMGLPTDEWLIVEQESGKASVGEQTVTFTVLRNTGKGRSADLIFMAGNLAETFTIHQNGEVEGEDDGSMTIAEFLELGEGESGRITGKITSNPNTQYGNFDVTDETGTVYVFGCTNVADYADQLIKGYDIVVEGPKSTYNNKIEMKNATIIKITPGEAPAVEAEDVTCAEFIAAPVSKTKFYRLTGTVSGSINSQYGNFDVKDETGSVYVYGLDNISTYASQLVSGAKVVVTGTRGDYNGKVEMLDGHLESIEAGEGGGGDSSDYQNAPEKSIADFISAADKNTYYKLTGTVSQYKYINYMTFDLTDASGTIYIYRITNQTEWKDKIKDGDTVVLAGTYDYYEAQTKHEVVNAHILSVNDSGEGGGGAQQETVTIEGVVAAVSAKAIVVQTATGFQYVFADAAPGVAVGDQVTVEGVAATYNNIAQISSPTITKVSSGNQVNYPSVTALDAAAFSTYSTALGYVKFSGTLIKSGNYFNVEVTGSTRTGSLSYPTSEYPDLQNKTVDVTGFFVGISGGSFFNVVVTEIELSENQEDHSLQHPLDANVTWTLGDGAYDKSSTGNNKQSGTFNGVSVENLLKLGTSSKGGTATIKVPAGSTKVGFYCVGFSKDQSDGKTPFKITAKAGNATVGEFSIERYIASGNPPYTLMLSDATDYYMIDFDALAADTDVVITSTGRMILVGINAE